MRRYWVIAPYDSTKTQVFERVWDYDLKNETIAIGWGSLGDVSQMSMSELSQKFRELWGEKGLTRDCNSIWRFYHEITPGDIIVARRGTKKMIGIGTVTGTAFYDEEKGKQRVGDPNYSFYPNFVKVKWEEKEIEFDKIIFSFYTIYEIPEEKYSSLIERKPPEGVEEGVEQPAEFVMEKYLEDFIVANFKHIFKGQLELYRDPEDNKGQQYPIIGSEGKEIGRIDILAKEPSTNSYVVIELKKGRESDKVIGQILRYMSAVRETLCQEDEKFKNVKGLIICKDVDERLSYALKMVQDIVKVKFYSVDFRLYD